MYLNRKHHNQVDIDKWIEISKNDPHLYLERRATAVFLSAIGASESFSAKLFLKGGTLMGVVYESPRQTSDIDLTGSFDPTDYMLDQLCNSFDEELKRTAARLGEPDLVCQIQTLKKRPKSSTFKGHPTPAIELKVAYAMRGSSSHRRFVDKQCPTTLKVEISFNEPVEAIEWVSLENGSGIKAYALVELIAEKIRALLQQPVRKRNRRQDVFDIAYLVRGSEFDIQQQAEILERLIKKCRCRGLVISRESISEPEIRKRAEIEWETIRLEVVDLPTFDSQFKIVEKFYKELPW